MTVPRSSNGLGNILRLQGLKNVSGRRRVLGAIPLLEELQNAETDVAGTAGDLENAPQNLPMADMGGELDAQSYDVRANQVMNEPAMPQTANEAPADDNMMYRLGKSLQQQTQNYNANPEPEAAAPSAEDLYPRLQAMSHLFPDYQNMKPEQKQVLENALTRTENEMAERKKSLMPREALMANMTPPIETQQVDVEEGLPPVTPEGEAAAQQASSLNFEELPKTPEEVGTNAVPGAVDEVFMNPELKSEMERVFGVSVTPEMQQQLNDMEAAVKGYTDALQGAQTNLTEHQEFLRQKIERRDLSAGESIMMAMSVLAPALVMGLIAGKEGFVGGVAGGAQAVASNLAEREKDRESAYKLKSELGIKGAELGMKSIEAQANAAELRGKIQKSLPNAALKKLFDEVGGEIVNGKLVFNTGNPLMPLKSSAVRRPEDYDKFMKDTKPDLDRRLRYVEGGIKNLDRLDKMIDYAMKEAAPEGFKTLEKTAKAFIPAARTQMVDENGNKIKLEQAFQTELEQLSDAYAQSIGVGGSKGGSEGYRKHVLNQIQNPFTTGSYFFGDTQLSTIKHQAQQIKDKLESDVVRAFDLAGVETAPLKELFKSQPINTRSSEADRKKTRAQEAAREVIEG